MNAIETKNLTKFYGKARGIVDVSLSVEEGDLFGFIGPNGAGKSTLIRTLLGLIAPTGGSARVLGHDVMSERTEILGQVGYLPSEAAFYHEMRVGELLEFSAKLRGVNCREERERLLERLALDPTRRIRHLSLGNRKKVGIVCALQHKPSLYILDEPTSGLDPLMQKEFYTILKERNDEGATVFLSSHVLSEIERYCKHTAVIREGRIVVSESIEELGQQGGKRVTLRGVRELPVIAGAGEMVWRDNAVSFLYRGDAVSLVRALAALSFDDLCIEDSELDEVVMDYYKKEENENADLSS